MLETRLPPFLREIPHEARGAIACYVASSLCLFAVVVSDVDLYVQCAVVIYTQLLMVLVALGHGGGKTGPRMQ